MNYLLYRVFAGERRGLLRNLKAGSRTVHGSGVSLIAVLRREAAVDGDAAGTQLVTRDAVHEVVIRPRPR